MRGAARRRRDRRVFRLRAAPARLDDRDRSDPGRELVVGARLPAGAERQRDDVRALAQAARRMEIRHGPARRRRGRRHGELRADLPRDADRLARPRRRPLQDGGPDAGTEARPLPAPRRGRRGGSGDLPGGRRPLPEARRGGVRALRRAPLPRLPLPADAFRSHSVQRPRAPRGERQPRPRALARRRLVEEGPGDAALARVRPLLERQVPPSRRSRLGSRVGLPGPRGQQPPLGLRGPDRVLRRRPRGAQRPAQPRALPGEPRAVCGGNGLAGGARVAPARGHGRGGAASLRRPAGLGGLAPGRGFLSRERAHLARGRHDHPAEVRGQEIARRFRARVPRRAGRRHRPSRPTGTRT